MNISTIVTELSHTISVIVTQNWFSPVVSAITIPILAWTAWEALKTSRATSQANNLKLLPLLGLYFYQGRRSEDDTFKVKNLGEGVAYDIQIDEWTLIAQDTHEIVDLKMAMPGTNILSRDEEKEIETEVYVNGEKTNISRGFMLALFRGLNKSGIQIHFRDATGRECACLIGFDNKYVNILKPTYQVRFWHRIDIWYGLKIKKNFKIWRERFFWRFEERSFGTITSYKVRLWRVIRKELGKIKL
jgi:hypothetical protein